MRVQDVRRSLRSTTLRLSVPSAKIAQPSNAPIWRARDLKEREGANWVPTISTSSPA